MQTDQINFRKKWKQVQNLANMCWNRWLKEYISTLTSHSKWTWQIRNFKIGDLVIIKTKYIPQNHWPLGWVIETFVGSDDIIRSIKVKTPSAELIRPNQVIRYACWKPQMLRHGTGLNYQGRRMCRHILLIKHNSIFADHLQWYWIRHYVFDWFLSLIIIRSFLFLIVTGFLHTAASSVLHTFFLHQSPEDKRESGCQISVKNQGLKLKRVFSN